MAPTLHTDYGPLATVVQPSTLSDVCCQAQYQLQLNYSWAELVLHLADPASQQATHPLTNPPGHPPGIV